LSSTRSANHDRVESAGDSAGQPLNRVFERHSIDRAIRLSTAAAVLAVAGIAAYEGYSEDRDVETYAKPCYY